MARTTSGRGPKEASPGSTFRGEGRDALLRLASTGPIRDAMAQKALRRPVGRSKKSAERSSDAKAQKVRRPVTRSQKIAEQTSNATAQKARKPVTRSQKLAKKSPNAVASRKAMKCPGQSMSEPILICDESTSDEDDENDEND